jgi:hypothetical protein
MSGDFLALNQILEAVVRAGDVADALDRDRVEVVPAVSARAAGICGPAELRRSCPAHVLTREELEMPKCRLLFALLGVFVLTAAPLVAGDDVTFEGIFEWVRDDGTKDGDLRAVLTPSGEGEWDVAFHFEWQDGPHIYTGSCSGSLDGELSGAIVSDGEREMKFHFTGKFEEGTFSGTHAFVDDEGSLKDSGTLTLGASGE